MLNRLEQALVDRTREDGDRWVEIYHRAAWTRRLSRRDGVVSHHVGREEGVAVRTVDPSTGELRFGASSGGDRAAVARAASGARSIGSGGRPRIAAVELADRDGDVLVPEAETLREWIEPIASRAPAWVEVAITLENWVSSDGSRASRRRLRAWSMLECRPPVFVAARGWDTRAVERWCDEVAERIRAEAAPRSARPGRIVLLPTPAATLVHRMTAILHGTQPPIGAEVGPGWDLVHDPEEPGALFGGPFDDDLLPTHSTRLAENGRIVGGIAGPGHARRASFRDPPECAHSCLVVRPPKLERTSDDRTFSGVHVHAVGSEWVLELEPGPVWVRTDPLRLARACLGGVGPRRPTHRGVICPSLVFEI